MGMINRKYQKTKLKPKARVTVIGAGCAGIVSAAILAKEGYDVTLLEKNDCLGGRCSNLYLNKNRFDVGPSIYVLEDVYNRVYDRVDKDFRKKIKLLKAEPNYIIYDNEGKKDQTVSLYTQEEKMKAEFKKYNQDINMYSKFRKVRFLL